MALHEPAEIRLVNKIAIHFDYLPTDQAVAAVADHVTKFWDPRMKSRLFELAAAESGHLDPVAAAAAALLR